MTPALAEGSAPVSLQGTFRRLNGLPPRSLIALMLGIAALIAVASAAYMWSSTPNYKVLFTNVNDRDGGAILAALTQMNVPYKMSDGSGAILIPADKVAEVRLKLASQGLPKGGTVGFELMDNQKLGTTQFQEQVNYQRGLEGELAKSIQSLSAVAGARVHLAMPRPSVFMRDSEKPSASVVVQLHPGRTLDRAQVAGILHLVASSVPELPVKNVSVVDENGNLLSAPVDNLAGGRLDAQQLAWVREVEVSLTKRIEDILEPVVGRGNVRAQVTADMDFSLTESTAETYKPNQDPGSATVRSSKTNEQGVAANATAQGVPGATSNQPGAQAAAAAANNANAANMKREATVNYEVDKTVKVTRAPMGSVKRLSAAVVVNHRKVVTDGKTTMVPLAKEEIEQIQSLVREAMGFQEARKDSLNVANTPFTVPERAEIPEVPLWKQPETISMAKDAGTTLGLVIAALFIFFGVIRPAMRAVTRPPEAAAAAALAAPEHAAALPSPDGRDRAALARDLAKQDPKVVANVVKSWVSGNE